jgi:hypothetical protein
MAPTHCDVSVAGGEWDSYHRCFRVACRKCSLAYRIQPHTRDGVFEPDYVKSQHVVIGSAWDEGSFTRSSTTVFYFQEEFDGGLENL